MNRRALYLSAVIAAAFVVEGALATRTSAEDAVAILAKHRAFMGWTAGDGTFTSWRTTEVFEKTAQSGTDKSKSERYVFTTLHRGSLYHETDTRESDAFISSENGFTGRVFWDADENGFVVTVLGDAAHYRVSENALSTDLLATLPGVLRPDAKIGDETLQVVRVTPSQGFPVDLYIAPDGAYRRVAINPDVDSKEVFNIHKYSDVLPGKRFITNYDLGASPITTKVDVNVSISDDDLRPPRPRAHWNFASPDSVPIDIVSHTYQDGSVGWAVQLRAAVNGHEGTFLLDSGAASVVLFDPFASSLALATLAHSGYTGVSGGKVDASLVRVKQLTLGKNTLENLVVVKSNGQGVSGVDGILGYDALAGALVDVDLVEKKLNVLDPAQYAPTVEKGAYAFPVDLTDRTPSVVGTVSNGTKFEPTLDTGDDFDVVISDSLRTSGRVVAFTGGDEQWFSGVDGTSPEPIPCARLNQMTVGPYRYENSHVCFGKPKVFGEDGGIIGFDFLRHFNWIFDYPDGKVVLTPNGQ